MVSTRSASRTSSAAIIPTTPSQSSVTGWAHTPTNLTLLWLAIAIPLVTWDTIYVLGRPSTMEGGWLHWPFWVPYKLYGEVDHVYGWKAFHARNGFTAAQGFLNAIETSMYIWYLYLYLGKGYSVGAAGAKKVVEGRAGARALLVGFSAAVMTLSKTILYWANEYYSGFDNIGHNSMIDLIFLWIIPNGAWLVGSTYMVWQMGGDISDGLALAARSRKSQ